MQSKELVATQNEKFAFLIRNTIMSCPALFYNMSCLFIRFLTVLAYLCVGAAVFRTIEMDSKGTGWAAKSEVEQYFDWFHFAFTSITTIGKLVFLVLNILG